MRRAGQVAHVGALLHRRSGALDEPDTDRLTPRPDHRGSDDTQPDIIRRAADLRRDTDLTEPGMLRRREPTASAEHRQMTMHARGTTDQQSDHDGKNSWCSMVDGWPATTMIDTCD